MKSGKERESIKNKTKKDDLTENTFTNEFYPYVQFQEKYFH